MRRTPSSRWVLAMLLGSAAMAVACATIVGIDEPEPRSDTDASGVDDAGMDATRRDADREGDAKRDGMTKPERDARSDSETPDDSSVDDAGEAGIDEDAGDDGGSDADDASCGASPDPTLGVFVQTAVGQDGPVCGTLAAPCATVQQGILRAQAGVKTFVYVARGTYFGPFTLAKGLIVEGGFDVTGKVWTPICPPQSTAAVVLSGSANQTATVVAQDLGGKATLETLTVLSKAASDVAPGETVYGIQATGTSTTLLLDDVVVQVAAGGAGTPGDGGAPGAAAPDGGCEGGTAGTGGPGSAGDAAPAGAFDAGGYASTSGGVGTTGDPGDPGTAGGNGACMSGSSCYCGPSASDFCASPVCGEQGVSGCGGGGGGGGNPGQGGGSSIAIFVEGATVRGSGGILQAGSGGPGGAGGPGGGGGPGVSGSPGTSATCNTACDCIPSFCCVPSSPVTVDGGSPGGTGGTGGTGGPGGGGAGGWSCSYVALEDASVTWAGTRLIAADGGPGGPPNGPPGVSQEHCP